MGMGCGKVVGLLEMEHGTYRMDGEGRGNHADDRVALIPNDLTPPPYGHCTCINWY